MPKVIDSFLVSLGFDLDEQSEKESTQAIDRMRGNALKLGAALTAAFAAATYAAKQTAGEVENLSNAATKIPGVSTNFLDQLAFAIDRAGGDASEAEPLLKSLQDTLFNFKNLGEGFEPFEQLEKLNIDSSFLADSQNAVEFLQRLVDVIDQIDDRGRQVAALDALGISGGAQNLILRGPDEFKEYIRRARELSTISADLEETSGELSRSFDDMGRALKNLTREFTEIAGPSIGSVIDGWTDKLVDFGDMIEGVSNLSPKMEINDNTSAGKFIRFFVGEGKISTPVDSKQPLRQKLKNEGFYDGGLEYVPQIPSPPPVINPSGGNTTNTNKIDRLEINVNESKDAKETAREVVNEVSKVFGITEQELRTATAG